VKVGRARRYQENKIEGSHRKKKRREINKKGIK